MRHLNAHQVLSSLGLEPRRSTSARVATYSSMVGLGAALGAGVMLLWRLEPVRKLLRRRPEEVAAPKEATPSKLKTA